MGNGRKGDLPGEDWGSALGRSSVAMVMCWGEIEVEANGLFYHHCPSRSVRPFARWVRLHIFRLQSSWLFINRCVIFHGAITYGSELEKRPCWSKMGHPWNDEVASGRRLLYIKPTFNYKDLNTEPADITTTFMYKNNIMACVYIHIESGNKRGTTDLYQLSTIMFAVNGRHNKFVQPSAEGMLRANASISESL